MSSRVRMAGLDSGAKGGSGEGAGGGWATQALMRRKQRVPAQGWRR